MEILKTLLVILDVIAAVGIIVLVLLQQGKGADAGASFGGGGSGSVFGAVGSANFLSRSTAWLATVFIVCTVLLAFVASGRTVGSGSVLQNAQPVPVQAPAAPTDGIPK
ncbi:MAG: preprotein translocase subunit SecG [Formosimonas sp.]